MRAVIQRVRRASVSINEVVKDSIEQGLLVLLGIEAEDTEEDVNWLCRKIIQMRIFLDNEGKMNTSIQDCNGNILLISQFTLFASTKKGNRPSFIKAATPVVAIPLYELMIHKLEELLQRPIACGAFGADMQVSLVNDGPVTIIIDSKQPE